MHISVWLWFIYCYIDTGVETQEINEKDNENATDHQPHNEVPDEAQGTLSTLLAEDEETITDSTHERTLPGDEDEALQCGHKYRKDFSETLAGYKWKR